MIATIEFIQESFVKFNELCFSGRLPIVRFILSRSRTSIGRCEYKKQSNLLGKSTNYDFVIKISTSFDLSKAELEDIIIHEMIHYYIAFFNIRDTSSHGNYFKHMMNEINERYGRHISVRGKIDSNSGSIVPSDAIKLHYICVTSLKGGERGITICAKTRIFEIHRLLPKYYRIEEMEWFVSADPFFSRYPRSNTPKIYRISNEELEKHIIGAIRMVCTGHVFRPA